MTKKTRDLSVDRLKEIVDSESSIYIADSDEINLLAQFSLACRLSKVFMIAGKELTATQSWIAEHDKKHIGAKPTAIGGRYTYSFTPTTLGTAIKVKCSCGDSIDPTVYDW